MDSRKIRHIRQLRQMNSRKETTTNPLEQFTDNELLQELHRRGLKLNDLRHITYFHGTYEESNRDPMIIDEEEKHAN